MSRDNPGGIHFHSFWLERATDKELQLWVRVVALAYGSHRANGHANWGPGYLAAFFDKSASQVCTAITTAKVNGFLAEESNIRCLVVPEGIAGGLGHPDDPCRDPAHRRTPV